MNRTWTRWLLPALCSTVFACSGSNESELNNELGTLEAGAVTDAAQPSGDAEDDLPDADDSAVTTEADAAEDASVAAEVDAAPVVTQGPYCGDGRTDEGESCDDGERNSNTAPDACRLNCLPARCGDAVTDTREQCDDGVAKNSNHEPNACRVDCTSPRCGDGVLDDAKGEECDTGPARSNTASGACRLDCKKAR